MKIFFYFLLIDEQKDERNRAKVAYNDFELCN